MDVYKLIQTLLRNFKYLAIIPVVAGGLMYILTRNNPKVYSCQGSIYTAITSNSSLEDLGNNRVDYFSTKTAYNNLLSLLKSRSIQEETALRLLANHLVLDKPQKAIISEKAFYGLHEIVPEDLKAKIEGKNTVEAYSVLSQYLNQDNTNFLYGLLHFDHPYYSYKAIASVEAAQDNGSDIIVLTYQSDDAAIAYQTLKILIDVFIKKYSLFKKNQTNAVVEYFERQLKKSSEQLNDAEDRLLTFNKSNRIINYYEQTKHISSQQEKIEVKLQDVLMEFQASEAVLQKLEVETSARFHINLKNKEIMDLRQDLININAQIAQEELEADSIGLIPSASPLDTQKNKLEIKLQNKLDSLFFLERNADGLEMKVLLNDWLKTVIEYESAKARLIAMRQKEKEYRELYARYAPLGAILKRIEREIDVKEQAYLEILHHLGLAKLKQQNEEMMANMKIVDPPQLPIDAEPDKRKILVIVIGLFSFIISLLAIVAFELLDRTIKSPVRFEQLAGIPVHNASVFVKDDSYKQLHNLHQRSTKNMLEELIAKRNTASRQAPVFVIVFSNWEQEGKTYTIALLKSMLETYGFNIASVQIDNNGLLTHSNFDEWEKDTANGNSDFVFVEWPGLNNTVLNRQLISHAHACLYISDAHRTWAKADSIMLNNLKEIAPNLTGFLNKVYMHNLEELIGEIPKHRSKFRQHTKRIFKRLLG